MYTVRARVSPYSPLPGECFVVTDCARVPSTGRDVVVGGVSPTTVRVALLPTAGIVIVVVVVVFVVVVVVVIFVIPAGGVTDARVADLPSFVVVGDCVRVLVVVGVVVVVVVVVIVVVGVVVGAAVLVLVVVIVVSVDDIHCNRQVLHLCIIMTFIRSCTFGPRCINVIRGS